MSVATSDWGPYQQAQKFRHYLIREAEPPVLPKRSGCLSVCRVSVGCMLGGLRDVCVVAVLVAFTRSRFVYGVWGVSSACPVLYVRGYVLGVWFV